MLRRQDRQKLDWYVMLSRQSQPPTSDNEGKKKLHCIWRPWKH